MTDLDDEQLQLNTLTNDGNLNKYKTAGEIANQSLALLLKSAAAGKTPLQLCVIGDALVKGQTDVAFKKARDEKGNELKRGGAFPVCVSVNECVCHYSPLKSEESEMRPLEAGDVVKIELGIHIDGFIACAAGTVIIPGAADVERQNRVTLAALQAAQAALAKFEPDVESSEVVKTLDTVAEAYGVKIVKAVKPIEKLGRYHLDDYTSLGVSPEDEKRPSFKLEKDAVYSLNVITTTGQGKVAIKDAKTTVYKKNLGNKYDLKMKSSRAFISSLPHVLGFSLRQLEDESQARFGVKECAEHELVTVYPVIFEKQAELVAQFKLTILMMPGGGRSRLCGVKYEDTLATLKPVADVKLAEELVEAIKNADAKKKKPAAAPVKA